MYFSLKWNLEDLTKKLNGMQDKVNAAVLIYANTKSQQLESYMKDNRPWTDRSNFAKRGLRSQVSQPDENTVRITLSHGVEYGIWLELAHGKNWAIVAPTLLTKGPEVMNGLENLLNRFE